MKPITTVLGKIYRKIQIPYSAVRITAKIIGEVYPATPDITDNELSKELNSRSTDPGSSAIHADNIIELSREWDVQVIVPVYNVENTVARCIDSIIAQEGELKILITVINDGSPDGSREILRRYEGRYDIEIIDQDNRGFSGARNTALRNIKAEYVSFVDSDDYMPLSAMKTLLKIARRTQADIVQGSYESVDINGNRIDTEIVADKDSNGDLLGYPWGKLFKAELFRNVQFPEGYWFEDTINAILLFPMSAHTASTSAITYSYTQNPTGITNSSVYNLKSLDSYYITAQLYKDRQTLGIPLTHNDYNHFIQQIATNHKRIEFIADKRLQELVMIGHNHLRRRYFGLFKSTDRYGRLIERAVDSRNMALLRFALAIQK